MKIDIDSGAIEFETGVIAPTMTLARFLSSPIGRSSTKTLTSAQWVQFSVEPEPGVGAIVIFDGDAVDRVLLAMRLPSDAGGDWSERVELERKRHHDAWLKTHAGKPPYDYAWGRVESEYDSKGCASAIIVSYDR